VTTLDSNAEFGSGIAGMPTTNGMGPHHGIRKPEGRSVRSSSGGTTVRPASPAGGWGARRERARLIPAFC
jgi:hypothetical protein